ncbi:MAG: phosphatidylglycerol lysyltransferase domain-containing protein [Eubacteriales bacterium]
MLEFRTLTLEDLPKLRHFFSYSGSRICDTTPGTVFMWRDMYHTEYAIHDNSLYFKVDYQGGSTFTLPLGGGRTEHYRNIAEYCCHHGLSLSFYPVPKEEVDRMDQHFDSIEAIPTRETFDYLYSAEDLQFFKGKKLSGQRNHVNRFLKTYENWEFRKFESTDVPAIEIFLDEYNKKIEKQSDTFHEELLKTKEVLSHFSIYDMFGGILFVDGKIVGFSLGEVVGDTLFTHIEKANREILGCYQMLVSQFAQMYAGGATSFINREDDAGDEGLRTSKLSYKPVLLLEKNVVKVASPCHFQPKKNTGYQWR